MSDISIICLIILSIPFIMLGLVKYVNFVSSLVTKYGGGSDYENFCMMLLLIGAPLIWGLGGLMLYVMIRDYGWVFLWVPVTLIIAFATIWYMVEHDHI